MGMMEIVFCTIQGMALELIKEAGTGVAGKVCLDMALDFRPSGFFQSDFKADVYRKV